MSTRIQKGKSELIEIKGITFEVKSMVRLEYSGQWVHDGFDLYIHQKKIKTFVGCPTNKNILDSFQQMRTNENHDHTCANNRNNNRNRNQSNDKNS